MTGSRCFGTGGLIGCVYVPVKKVWLGISNGWLAIKRTITYCFEVDDSNHRQHSLNCLNRRLY